jgi:hypothetical protein
MAKRWRGGKVRCIVLSNARRAPEYINLSAGCLGLASQFVGKNGTPRFCHKRDLHKTVVVTLSDGKVVRQRMVRSWPLIACQNSRRNLRPGNKSVPAGGGEPAVAAGGGGEAAAGICPSSQETFSPIGKKSGRAGNTRPSPLTKQNDNFQPKFLAYVKKVPRESGHATEAKGDSRSGGQGSGGEESGGGESCGGGSGNRDADPVSDSNSKMKGKPPDGCKEPVINQQRKDGGGGSGSGNGSSGPEDITVVPKSKVSDKGQKNSKGTKTQNTNGGGRGRSIESVTEDLLEVCWTAVAGTVLKAGDAQSSRNGQVSSAPDVKTGASAVIATADAVSAADHDAAAADATLPSAASAPTVSELPASPRTGKDEASPLMDLTND